MLKLWPEVVVVEWDQRQQVVVVVVVVGVVTSIVVILFSQRPREARVKKALLSVVCVKGT